MCAIEYFKDLRPQFVTCVASGSNQLCNNTESGGAPAECNLWQGQ